MATADLTGWGRRVGFRGRVLGSLVTIVLAALALALVLQRGILLDRLDDRISAELRQERDELAALATGTDPDTGRPFGGDVRAIFDTFLARNLPRAGEAYFTFLDGQAYISTPAPLRLDQRPELAGAWSRVDTVVLDRFDTEAGPVRAMAVPLLVEGRTGGVLVVTLFLRDEREAIDRSIRVGAAVAGITVLLAAALSWWIAGRLLRPIRQLTEAAESISEVDTARRIPAEGTDEIARLARRFNEMLDRLAAAFAAQRSFVDDAGHELRTPITIVRGHLELMGDDPQDRVETVALVTDELDRMARIVDDLLLLAKAEQPDFVHPEPTELADLTTDLFAKARALGARDWRLDACATGHVLVDPHRITQAVLNLARNAVDHTGPGTRVGLGSRLDDDRVILWVRDDGPGIAPEEHAHVFERFGRGRGHRSATEGAGLGLAIVRSVAEAHGGTVRLDSAPARGATFTLDLPAHRPGADPADDPTSSPPEDLP